MQVRSPSCNDNIQREVRNSNFASKLQAPHFFTSMLSFPLFLSTSFTRLLHCLLPFISILPLPFHFTAAPYLAHLISSVLPSFLPISLFCPSPQPCSVTVNERWGSACWCWCQENLISSTQLLEQKSELNTCNAPSPPLQKLPLAARRWKIGLHLSLCTTPPWHIFHPLSLCLP